MHVESKVLHSSHMETCFAPQIHLQATGQTKLGLSQLCMLHRCYLTYRLCKCRP